MEWLQAWWPQIVFVLLAGLAVVRAYLKLSSRQDALELAHKTEAKKCDDRYKRDLDVHTELRKAAELVAANLAEMKEAIIAIQTNVEWLIKAWQTEEDKR
jgi:hypothetical protein